MPVRWVLEDGQRPGGAEAVVRALDEGMRATGVRSSVHSWNPAAAPGDDASPLAWLAARLKASRQRDKRARAAAAELARAIAADPELVVVLDPGSLPVARHLLGLPRWGVHLHWSPDLVLQPWRHIGGDPIPTLGAPLVHARLRAVGRSNAQLLRSAPFVVTLTASHTRAMHELGAAVRQIENPVASPVGDQSRRSPSDEVTLGYVGRLSWEKAPDVLIEAVAHLPPAAGRWRLLVAGSGPASADVTRLTRALTQARIQLLGWVDDPERVLAQVDILALPSRTEAVPLVLVQALAAGCSVVATESGSGVRDLLLDGQLGRLVPPDDPAALARALEGAMADVRAGRRPPHNEVQAVVAAHDPARVIAIWRALLADVNGTAAAGRGT